MARVLFAVPVMRQRRRRAQLNPSVPGGKGANGVRSTVRRTVVEDDYLDFNAARGEQAFNQAPDGPFFIARWDENRHRARQDAAALSTPADSRFTVQEHVP